MKVAARSIILAATAAGVAVTAFFTTPNTDDEDVAALSGQAGYEVCLKTQMPLFQNASASCYGAEELLALLDQPVLDLQGNLVVLTLAHPTDTTITERQARTCRDYRELSFDGWFAETTREMRREGYFVRACGALRAMLDAQAAQRSFFAQGSPTNEEMAALKGVLRTGAGEGDAERIAVAQPGDYQWRIAVDSQFVEIQELANADFDNDGIEEILVFLAGGAVGGTALFYDVGLIQKDAAGESARYAPLQFNQNETGGAAG